MIDCDIKFGSFQPKVPPQYKDAATDDDNCRTYCDCAIGPTWTALELISIKRYNHDTSIFEFKLPDPNMNLNLPVTGHFLVKAYSDDEVHVRPYTAIEESPGTFKMMVKLYKEWGVPESELKNRKVFLYAKTDHSYRPPGVVSNYIHSLKVGEKLEFKYNEICKGRIHFPFETNITNITMIAVGAGVAPMIRILRALLEGSKVYNGIKSIRLLYGVRTVDDILQKELLDKWHEASNNFKVCYCIGSRWGNVHFHAKTSNSQGPPLPQGWDSVPEDRKELGWVDGDKVQRRGSSDSKDEGHRIFICGLPGVYLSLAGPRSDVIVGKHTQLGRLGYSDFQVIKF